MTSFCSTWSSVPETDFPSYFSVAGFNSMAREAKVLFLYRMVSQGWLDMLWACKPFFSLGVITAPGKPFSYSVRLSVLTLGLFQLLDSQPFSSIARTSIKRWVPSKANPVLYSLVSSILQGVTHIFNPIKSSLNLNLVHSVLQIPSLNQYTRSLLWHCLRRWPSSMSSPAWGEYRLPGLWSPPFRSFKRTRLS